MIFFQLISIVTSTSLYLLIWQQSWLLRSPERLNKDAQQSHQANFIHFDKQYIKF
ncbi:MAG: hypothetical protein HC764_23565 [Pleurocapsa sp. CRU_1_2]|nr:hypothetical protein [Pleurocapsa sp. CRU_1_2]